MADLIRGLAALSVLLQLSALSSWSAPAPQNLSKELIREISVLKSGTYSDLLGSWARRHGSGVVAPLITIAENTKLSEKTRTIALLGAAEISRSRSGVEIRSRVSRLLLDRNWLIRLSAIKALDLLGSAGSAETIAERLRDPALVVRGEAADSLLHLARTRPEAGSARVLQLLSGALSESGNYSGGKALWVTRRALAALAAFRAKSELRLIARLLDHREDPALVEETMRCLETISGEKRGVRSVSEWKSRLLARR